MGRVQQMKEVPQRQLQVFAAEQVELGEGGNLLHLLGRSSLHTLSWKQRVELGIGVAAGVEFLHAQTPPIIHFDLKSQNVVLNLALTPKVCDFGISAFAHEARTVTNGTLAYMAPEVAQQRVLSNLCAVDVYGVGCVCHDLAHINTGVGPDQPPRDASGSFELASVDSQMRPLQIFVQRARNDFEPVVGPRVPPPFALLLFACLAVSPDARPTATAARLALAALAAQAGAWDAAEGSEAGGAGGRDNASGTALSSLPSTRSVNSLVEARHAICAVAL